MAKLLYKSNDWTQDDLNRIWDCIDDIATKEYGLSYYEPLMKIISAEQMAAVHASLGLPHMYSHWKFGRDYEQISEEYRQGRTSLSYEVILNSDPAICYLLDTNNTTMMTLVMCHAAVGHSHFFKNNYLMSEISSPKSIVAYSKYAQEYVAKLEREHTTYDVTTVLDHLHILADFSIDHAPRVKLTKESKIKRDEDRARAKQEAINPVFDRLDTIKGNILGDTIVKHHETNLLYFIAQNATLLDDEDRELINIVRRIQQYFSVQAKTKLINEGCASFWHYELMTNLYNSGRISDGNYLEFLHSHTGVLTQLSYESPRGYINPYALGYKIFEDIKRICIEQKPEDLKVFPQLKGAFWLDVIKEIAELYRDDSFILQWLSPKVVQDLKLFSAHFDSTKPYIEISNTQTLDQFYALRETISKTYSYEDRHPKISINKYYNTGTTELVLNYDKYNDRELTKNIDDLLKAVNFFMDCNVTLNIRAFDETCGRWVRVNSFKYEEGN